MPNRDGNGGQSFSDVAYPVVSGKDGEGLSDGFVEGLRRYVERVRRLIQIVDNDCAGPKRHAGNLAYSPIVRLLVSVATWPVKPDGHCANLLRGTTQYY